MFSFGGDILLGTILDVYSTLSMGEMRVDFIGKGNVWINNTYQPEEVDLARHIIWGSKSIGVNFGS